MRFGLLSQWFDPEPGPAAIPGALARELVSRGHEVVVLTGFPNYPTGTIYPGYQMKLRQHEFIEGVEVVRVPLFPDHSSRLAPRLLNYGSFGLSAATIGISSFKDVDAMWVYNSPATIALPMWTAQLLYRVPHVLHIMDLWPDSIFSTSFGQDMIPSRFLRKPIENWCKRMYRTSRYVAYISPSMGPELRKRGVPAEKLRFVPLWADAQIVNEIPRKELIQHQDESKRELTLLYAGALGPAQGLGDLLTAMSLLQNRRPIRLLIAGTGTRLEALKEQATQSRLTHVEFLGQLPKNRLSQLAQQVDMHVISLKASPLAEVTMPSKIQTTLALAKPFLAILSGDAAKTSSESEASVNARPGDPESIAAAIVTASELQPDELIAMGQRGRAYYERNFSIERASDSLEALLTEAATAKTKRHRKPVIASD